MPTPIRCSTTVQAAPGDLLTAGDVASWLSGGRVPEDAVLTPLFNFRTDSDLDDSCFCIDAASWPEPRHSHRLTPADDLEVRLRILAMQDAAAGVTP